MQTELEQSILVLQNKLERTPVVPLEEDVPGLVELAEQKLRETQFEMARETMRTKTLVEVDVRGHPFPTPHIQLRLWLCNSDSAHPTPIVAAQLRLRRHNSLRLPSPHHPPRCTHLPTYCTVLSHAHMAYIVVTPSRVFLRVFSLDFPLLG